MKGILKNVIAWAFILLIASLAPSSSFAGDFDYNYFDLCFVSADVDGADGLGVEAEGSYKVHEKAFVKLRYTYAEGSDDDVWYNELIIGGGTMFQIEEKLDFVAEGGIMFGWIEFNNFDDDDTGFALRGMLRYQAQDQLELFGGMIIASIWDDTDFGIEIGAAFKATDKLGVKAGYRTVGDVDVMYIGGRFFF